MFPMRPHGPSIARVLCALAVGFSCAAESQAGSQQAHVHGEAELTFSIEERRIEIQLESPAANIVGFESKAESPEQQQVVVQAREKLEAGQQLFTFTGATCHRESVAVDVSGVMAEAEGEHEAHAPGEADGESHHAPDHDHDGESHETHHSEIVANYRFRCDDTAGLSGITVDVFDVFPGIERMQAMWVTPARQGATELSAQHRIVSFE